MYVCCVRCVIPHRLSSKQSSRLHSKYTKDNPNTQIKFKNHPLNHFKPTF